MPPRTAPGGRRSQSQQGHGSRPVSAPEPPKDSPRKKKKPQGDGGTIGGRFAEAALERRGNEMARRELEDAGRIFNAVDQKNWEAKYKFFSGRHMDRSYRLFTKARHDPFNKDPSWGKSVMHRVSAICTERNMDPEQLFADCHISGSGDLNRPEMKRVICSVLPTLSDEELTAIFDTIDADHSGEINVKEFCDSIRQGRHLKVAKETADRWRNPIHRMKRFAPAQVEGWDHLEGEVKFTQTDKLCDSMQSQMEGRLSDTLTQSARLRTSYMTPRSKYEFFSGGGDGARFRRQQWTKDREMNDNQDSFTPRIKDPGPFPKPGWMYEIKLPERIDKHGTKFDIPKAPMSAR